MKFTISQTELKEALNIVQKGVSARSSLPVLSGIYLKVEGDKVVFQATDLELSIQYEAPAMIEEAGATVLPGKLACDIVKNLPDAAVVVETDESEATITCNNSAFKVKTLAAEDFPEFPNVAVDQQIAIPFESFSEMAKKVSRMTSRDEARPILTGVLVTLEGSTLRMVATDSYRLAVAEREVETDAADFSAVISGSFVNELASLPKTGDDIVLALADQQIRVSYQATVFVNRRIEGKYPNYKQLLPSSFLTRMNVGAKALSDAVRRVCLLGSNGSSVKMHLDAEAQVVTLSAMVQDIGSAEETLAAQIEGQTDDIAFNGDYVLDGLSSIDDETVSFEMQGPMKPGIFKPQDKQDYLYLAMPVRIV